MNQIKYLHLILLAFLQFELVILFFVDKHHYKLETTILKLAHFKDFDLHQIKYLHLILPAFWQAELVIFFFVDKHHYKLEAEAYILNLHQF